MKYMAPTTRTSVVCLGVIDQDRTISQQNLRETLPLHRAAGEITRPPERHRYDHQV